MSTSPLPKAVPYRPERSVTFKVWQGSYPVRSAAVDQAETFEDAVRAATWIHKQVITVLRIDAGKAEKELALYAIKQSAPKWRTGADGRTVRRCDLYPDLLHDVLVTEFAPVEPFDPFVDPVGIDRGLVVRHG